MTRIMLILAIGSLILMGLSVMIGSAPLSLGETLSALFGLGSEPAEVIVWEIRMPRTMAAFIVGATLGLSGAALQGLLQNPLAEPGVLGVSAFASLGSVIAIFFGLAAMSPLFVPVLAMVFSFGAVAILLLASGRGVNSITLLLVGIGLSSFAGAMISLALNLAPNPWSLSDLVNWTLGSVSNRSWRDILLILPICGLGAVLTFWSGPGLRVLTLGEETAASLGADPGRTRLLVVAGTSFLVGGSVALAGAIGFVGIVAPHLMRPFVRSNPQQLLWPSALAAGVIVLGADIVVRILPLDQELRLGVAAALFGAPVFIWIATRLGGTMR